MQPHQQQVRLLQPQNQHQQQQQHRRAPTPSCARNLPQQPNLKQQSSSRRQPTCLLSLALTKAVLQAQPLVWQLAASRSGLQLL
jgi:hypothetical protein